APKRAGCLHGKNPPIPRKSKRLAVSIGSRQRAAFSPKPKAFSHRPTPPAQHPGRAFPPNRKRKQDGRSKAPRSPEAAVPWNPLREAPEQARKDRKAARRSARDRAGRHREEVRREAREGARRCG